MNVTISPRVKNSPANFQNLSSRPNVKQNKSAFVWKNKQLRRQTVRSVLKKNVSRRKERSKQGSSRRRMNVSVSKKKKRTVGRRQKKSRD